MAVQDRNTAVQGEVVRLTRTFIYNGSFYTMPTAPTVEIVMENGTVLDTVTSAYETVGMYYADWTVPQDLDPGKYYDRWIYAYEGSSQNEETSYFQVYTADTWMSFTGGTSTMKVSDRIANLMRALDNDFIYEAQHIPVYWEQSMLTADPAKRNFAYGNWRKDPMPIVRRNGKIIDDGWVPDYKGNVFFQDVPQETDDINVTYTFSYFSDEELASFLNEGLRAMNSLPPASWNYSNIEQTPRHWEYGILLVAAMHAMRRLIMGLNFQERAIIFGENPDNARAVQNMFKDLYQSYSDTWKDVSDGIKKTLPAMGMIVIPEYTLPGGRARWYRYLYTTAAGG